MSELNNKDRADFAREAMEAYTARKGSDEPQTDLVDLLGDLRHFAAEEGLDFEAAVQTSLMHFEEESETDAAETCEHCGEEFRTCEMLNCPECGGHGCEECVLAGKCCQAHKLATVGDEMREAGYQLTDTGGGVEQWLKALNFREGSDAGKAFGTGYRIISARDGETVSDPGEPCIVQDYADGGEEVGNAREFDSLSEALRFE